ncbi:hypothetical protein CJF31_00004572 [Rutstroemia sp. NJR-2017a BVV2]|nr:hypothetical protein CJF31_00004572 [Rutstroemia sp. NJR-2017a BVV2]
MLRAHKSEADACLSALFLTDPLDDRAKLVQAKGLRVDGTCEWIQTNELYVSWLRSDSQLLWLSGGPGKGKTMLSVFLAEQLERTAKDLSNTLFLQYFCDNKNENHNTGVTVIRGLLYQLLQLQPKLFVHILPSFKIRRKSLFASSSFEALWRIFENMLRDPIIGSVHCILDGLDECDEGSSEVLLGNFRNLFLPGTKPSHHLKMIIVSRDLPQFIPVLLKGVPRIRLDPDADSELPAYELCPDKLRVYMKKTFKERAQGTFLWVSLVAKALKNCRATEIRRRLDEFPPGLDELYARMLLQIDVDRRALAAKILIWVVMAIRPLTLSELSIAVGIDAPSSDGFALADVMKDHVLYCGHFLTIKEEDEVGLIHQSVKDYLLRKTCDANPELEFFRVREEVGNLEVARKCLNYLQDGILAGGPVYLVLEYMRSGIPDLQGVKDSESLLLTRVSTRASSRQTASFFVIVPLLQNLLSKKWSKGLINRMRYLLDMDKKDEGPHGETALLYAAANGHSAAIQLLYENGADTEATNTTAYTALHLAAQNGSATTVQLLLEIEANIEAKSLDGTTALHIAAKYDHVAIIQLLYKKGANIEARNSRKETALRLAAENGNTATAQFLFEIGANIEAKSLDGARALHVAAECDRIAIVQLLYEKGANIEARNSRKETALYCGAITGSTATVQFLLKMGANMEAMTSLGGTALYGAAQMGHIGIMRSLLKKGASLEVHNMSEFRWVHICRRPEVVQLLVDQGAIIKSDYIKEGKRMGRP